jgi:parallel beta-helix repeat protein
MRFALSLKGGLAAVLTMAGAAGAHAQINPNTNIKWPFCPAGASVYSIPLNQCVANGAGAGVSSAQGVLPIQVNGDNNPHSGNIVISSLGAELQAQYMQVAPGQSAFVFPSSCSAPTPTTGWENACNNSSGSITSNNTGTASVFWNFSCSSLPSYITCANITAIYAVMISTASGANSPDQVGGCNLTGFAGCDTTSAKLTPSSSSDTWVATQVSRQITFSGTPNLSGLEIAITSTISLGSVFGSISASLVGLEIHYTGSAPPASTVLNIAPCAYYVSLTNTLSSTNPCDFGIDTGSVNAYQAIVPSAGYVPGSSISFLPNATNTSTTPTFTLDTGGVTTTITKGGSGGQVALAANDIVLGTIAVLRWNSASNTWQLMNPQNSSGGGAFDGGLGNSYQDVTEIAAPSNPASGNDRLYLNSTTHQLSCLTSSGGNCAPSGTLPTASAPGQIISSTAAGSNYAAQGQIFYNQTGDTISSIESECSSPCTYVVTVPQTITLGSSHTLASNVSLQFEAGGKWTVNGAFTLTIPGNVNGTLNQHFAGSSTIVFGKSTSFAFVEWFGAVNDGSTNSTTAIQLCLNALTSGQCVLQAGTYLTSSSLSVTTSSVGMIGTPGGGPGSGTSAISSVIEITSDGVDVLDIGGGSTIAYNAFQDFAVTRSVSPTGTATGISAINVGGMILDNTQSSNSVRSYYFAGTPAYGSGHISNNVAITISGGYGFYLDPTTRALASTRMNANTASTTGGGAGYGFYSNGAPTDLMMDRSETAGETYGIYFNCGGSSGQDIHVRNSILDDVVTSGIYLTGCAGVEIEGGWISNGGSATTAVDLESSTNITVQKGLQILGPSYSNAAIYLNATTYSAVEGVNFQGTGCGTCIALNGSNDNTITDNIVGAAGYPIHLAGSSYNAISGNTINAVGSFAGITLDSSSNHNHYVNLNAFSSASTPIADSGTDNQISGSGSGLSVCADTSGSGTTQSCTPSPTITPVTNTCVIYTTTTTNSGTGLTIDVGTLGAKSVAIPGSSGWTTTLTASIIPANKPLLACYDGTNWNVAQTGTQSGGGGGSFQYSVLPVPTSVSGFTQVNWLSGTGATQGAAGAINFSIVYNSSLNWQLLTASVPSTPWSAQIYTRQVQALFSGSSYPGFACTSLSGLYISDGTKLEGMEAVDVCSGTPGVRVERMNSVTSDDATEYGPNPQMIALSQTGIYERVCDSGTTLYWESSFDGQNWFNLYSESVGTWITPTTVGFGGLSAATSNPQILNVSGWQITSSATCP